jgi:hypothetical protein
MSQYDVTCISIALNCTTIVIRQRHRVIATMDDPNNNQPVYVAFPPSHKLMMELHDKGRVWACSLPFQEAPQDDATSKMVSLLDCQRDVNMDYMFPQWCTGVESEDRLLITEVKVAAALDGFSLVIGRRAHPSGSKSRCNSKRRTEITLSVRCTVSVRHTTEPRIGKPTVRGRTKSHCAVPSE